MDATTGSSARPVSARTDFSAEKSSRPIERLHVTFSRRAGRAVQHRHYILRDDPFSLPMTDM